MAPQVLADSGDETMPERSYVVSEINQLGAELKGRMVASKDFKYILFNGGANREQLFDLVQAWDAFGEGMDLALEENVDAHVEVAEQVAACEFVLEDHGQIVQATKAADAV